MTTTAADWHNGDLLPSQNELNPRAFEGYDIHVLRNTSSLPLRSILMLLEDNGNLVRADSATLPADVTAFNFSGEFAPVGTQPQDTQEGHGVRLNLRTGELTATPNPPTPRLRSFIVNARVQRTAGGALPFDMPGAQRGTDAICAFTPKTNALECIGQTFQGRMHPTFIGLADGTYAVFSGFNAAPTTPRTVADSGELLRPPFFESRQAPYRTHRLTGASRPVKAIGSSGHGG